MRGMRESSIITRQVLDKELCDKLVQTASLTIGCNVLITDKSCRVVSSNDPRREGSIHGASVEAVRTGQTTYHNKDAAMRLEGTMPGFTVPLYVEDEIVGTIGVTGSPQEVSRYVALIQQLAQVFLGFYSQQRSSMQQDYQKRNLLREIVTFDKRIRDPAEIYSLAYEAGVDLNVPRLAILVKNRQEGGKTADELKEAGRQIQEIILRFFGDVQDFVCCQNETEHVVLTCLPDGMQDSSMEKVMQVSRELEETIRKAGLSVFVGVGSLASDLEDLRLSYENACFVVRIQLAEIRKDVCLSMDDLMLEKLAASLPAEVCREAETGVFGVILRAPNYEEIMEIIGHWCRLRFQFTRTAEALHIHKSTLVYRFRRILELYGLDLYDFDRVVALYLLDVRRKLK